MGSQITVDAEALVRRLTKRIGELELQLAIRDEFIEKHCGKTEEGQHTEA